MRSDYRNGMLICTLLLLFYCERGGEPPKGPLPKKVVEEKVPIKTQERNDNLRMEPLDDLGRPGETVVLFDIENPDQVAVQIVPSKVPDIPRVQESPPVALPAPKPGEVLEDLPKIRDLISESQAARASGVVYGILESIDKKKDFSRELRDIEGLGFSACPALARVFSDQQIDWKKRWVAAMGLARLRSSESKAALLAGLNDELSVIRMASITALKNYPSSDVVDNIHRVFLNDNAMLVRNTAVDVLAKIRDPRSINVLASGLNNKGNFYKGKNLWIRNNIVKALGNTGMKDAVPHLMNLLKDPDKSLYEDTVASLERIVQASLPFDLREPGNVDNKVRWWLAWWESNKSQYM